ncbi:MAG: DUF3426 domain-containing protein [Candidatus Adiutrix sp.]|nr:DUF3426 domain-containing protein [Candidatus Adiutrix sp.]
MVSAYARFLLAAAWLMLCLAFGGGSAVAGDLEPSKPVPPPKSVTVQPKVTESAVPKPETAKASGRSNSDPYIGFIEVPLTFYYRENKDAGRLLIFTGQVRNNYPEPRSFIYLRGYLLSGNGEPVAERFAYAGNQLSEEVLTHLPMQEITTRLSIKSGKDNANLSISPGAEIPFMMVFDDVPQSAQEYRFDVVSSEPAGER